MCISAVMLLASHLCMNLEHSSLRAAHQHDPVLCSKPWRFSTWRSKNPFATRDSKDPTITNRQSKERLQSRMHLSLML